MENKPHKNVFQEVHQKIQEAKDNLRRAKDVRMDISRKDAEAEAREKGFDRPATEPAA
jgi:hypothetical protein